PERQMHRAADLLVVEGVAGELPDRVIHPDPQPADAPGAVVHSPPLPQEWLAFLGMRLDHLPALEAEPDPADAAAAKRRRVAEGDIALDARLLRPREALPVREVLLAVAGDPRAARDAERQVGVIRDDPDLAAFTEPS